MEELISVVIPVYNAESFLPACLDSILRQTYVCFEVILVDDGSKDGSLALCQDYAAKDSRVRVIHQENQGVSAARNAGVRHATGNYISFIDADDYIQEDYFQRLYQDLKEHQADMVCCSYTEILNGKENPDCVPKVLRSRKLTDIREVFAGIAACTESYWSCVWGKLIKAELVKAHQFSSSLKYGEDQAYMYELFLEQPVIYLDAYPGYYYVRNEFSATMRIDTFHVKKRIDEMRMCRERLEKLPEFAREYKQIFTTFYAESAVSAIIALTINGTKEELRQYREILLSDIRKLPGWAFSPKGRVHLLLCRCCPRTYRFLMRKRIGK